MAENKTKIDIFSGFLGAGKTTLIKKLIQEAFGGEKLVLIENEFGEIGIDGGFMRFPRSAQAGCGYLPPRPYPDRAFRRWQTV